MVTSSFIILEKAITIAIAKQAHTVINIFA
jgi:hypothetical protein